MGGEGEGEAMLDRQCFCSEEEWADYLEEKLDEARRSAEEFRDEAYWFRKAEASYDIDMGIPMKPALPWKEEE